LFQPIYHQKTIFDLNKAVKLLRKLKKIQKQPKSITVDNRLTAAIIEIQNQKPLKALGVERFFE